MDLSPISSIAPLHYFDIMTPISVELSDGLNRVELKLLA